MTILVCDRCGKETVSVERKRYLKKITYGFGVNDVKDVCDDCFEEFLVWFDMGKPLATQNSPNKCVD